MAWIHVPGLSGKVYVPDETNQKRKKHSCQNCFSCQWCDENRCRVCRSESDTCNTECKYPMKNPR